MSETVARPPLDGSWAWFKSLIEQQGVKDDDQIAYIEWNQNHDPDMEVFPNGRVRIL